MRSNALLVTALVILLGCGGATVNRAEWQQLSHEDRVLFVKSLIGAEKVKDAKGGNGRETSRPAEDYVNQIDQAYARGDARDAHLVFAELAR